LRLSNSILKRLSVSNDTEFRGRVQMALASIFPISDKSGVNQKGLYNLNNFHSNVYKSSEEISRKPNFKFYQQFWMLYKFLTNPFLVKFNSKI
jgi:THO complex subunit 1